MSAQEPWARVQPLARLLAALSHEGVSSRYARTDVLRPLLYPIPVFVAALPLLAFVEAPRWLLVAAAVMAGAGLAVYVGIFLYGFFARPDALRAERYDLERRLAESRVFGDSDAGLVEGELLGNMSAGTETDEIEDVSGGRL